MPPKKKAPPKAQPKKAPKLPKDVAYNHLKILNFSSSSPSSPELLNAIREVDKELRAKVGISQGHPRSKFFGKVNIEIHEKVQQVKHKFSAHDPAFLPEIVDIIENNKRSLEGADQVVADCFGFAILALHSLKDKIDLPIAFATIVGYGSHRVLLIGLKKEDVLDFDTANYKRGVDLDLKGGIPGQDLIEDQHYCLKPLSSFTKQDQVTVIDYWNGHYCHITDLADYLKKLDTSYRPQYFADYPEKTDKMVINIEYHLQKNESLLEPKPRNNVIIVEEEQKPGIITEEKKSEVSRLAAGIANLNVFEEHSNQDSTLTSTPPEFH